MIMRSSKEIVEVCSSWPAEVFIQRHIQALQNEGVTIKIAALQVGLPISDRASVQNQEFKVEHAEIPSFNRLSAGKKIVAAIRYGMYAGFRKTGRSIQHADPESSC